MFVKIVMQGDLASPGSELFDSESDRIALRACIDGFETEMRARLAGVSDAGPFDCLMAFVWAASEVDASKSYARLVRRDRVFETSSSLVVERIRAGDVSRVAREIIVLALDSLCDGLRERTLGLDVRRVLDERRRELP